MALLPAAVLFSAGSAGAGTVVSVWDHAAPDFEPYFPRGAACTTPDGGLSLVTARVVGAAERLVLLTLSPRGEASRTVLPELPKELGKPRQRDLGCLWRGNGELLVLDDAGDVGLAAIWFDADLEVTDWVALERVHRDGHAQAIVETAPERFVAVGTSMLNAWAVRFDRSGVEPLTLPWDQDRERLLLDVLPEPGGGLTVCGMEAGPETTETPIPTGVIATLDAAGVLRAEARFRGNTCRLLPRRSGRQRVLYDDAEAPMPTLWLATLDDHLQPLSREPLVKPFVSMLHLPAVEANGTVFAASRWLASESLEARGPSVNESLHLEMIPFGILNLLSGGPSRLYLVSRTLGEKESGVPLRYGLRVQAFDVEGVRQ